MGMRGLNSSPSDEGTNRIHRKLLGWFQKTSPSLPRTLCKGKIRTDLLCILTLSLLSINILDEKNILQKKSLSVSGGLYAVGRMLRHLHKVFTWAGASALLVASEIVDNANAIGWLCHLLGIEFWPTDQDPASRFQISTLCCFLLSRNPMDAHAPKQNQLPSRDQPGPACLGSSGDQPKICVLTRRRTDLRGALLWKS
jgi:hypothetical protein